MKKICLMTSLLLTLACSQQTSIHADLHSIATNNWILLGATILDNFFYLDTSLRGTWESLRGSHRKVLVDGIFVDQGKPEKSNYQKITELAFKPISPQLWWRKIESAIDIFIPLDEQTRFKTVLQRLSIFCNTNPCLTLAAGTNLAFRGIRCIKLRQPRQRQIQHTT